MEARTITHWRISYGRMEGMLQGSVVTTSKIVDIIKDEAGRRFLLTATGSWYKLEGPTYLGELRKGV